MKQINSALLLLATLCLLQKSYAVAPVFTMPLPDGSSVKSVAENTATATSIYSVLATDADGDPITYTLTQSPVTTPAKFSISGQTISVNDPLDFEIATSYTLTITATANADTVTAQLAIQIQNVNDETPTLTGTFAATINEGQAVGTVLPTMFAASDADAGDTLHYSISSSTKFQIDAGTGEISIKSLIDYESGVTSFTFTLTVKDSASPQHSVTQLLTVTITDINDNTPTFTPVLYYVSLAENTGSGVSVQLLTVTDADAATTLTITIASGDAAPTKFQMNTGNNRLIETTSNAIDYEALSGSNYKYTLTMEASDGTHTGTATIIVSITGVNEAAPTWGTFSPATTPYYISENVAIGTTIVTIVASDSDEGNDGSILYSIGTITPNVAGVTSGLFYLDQVTGVLTTTSTSLDRETIQYYDIVVKARDQGTTPQSAERTIRVELTDYNDNTPTFSQNLYSYSFPETTLASTSLLVVGATDADITATTLIYSLETSSTPSSYSTYFMLDTTTTNQINLKAAIDLDAGAASSFTLVVKVTDGGSPALTSTCQVVMTVTSVNDFTPTFSPTTVTTSIDEDAAEGDTVTTFAATDGDSGNDGSLTYSITGGNSANKFVIDPTTGEIKVAGSLNYETTIQYILEVKAVDKGTTPKTGSGSVTINITDINDTPPTCTTNAYTETILETVTVPYTIATLSCITGDTVGSLAYSLSAGNTGGHFSVSAAGVVTLVTAVDYDAGQTSFTLTLTVTDGSFAINIPISVSVEPVNEATPTFPANLVVTFAENTAIGTSLVTHAASDSDAYPHGVTRYEISSGAA